MYKKALDPWIIPVWITLILCSCFVMFTLIKVDGDIFQFIFIGTRFSEGDPQGSEGYDGQFGYYIAVDPNPQRVKHHLDVPAYRYQRILLPLMARALSLGNDQLIAWWLVIIPLLGQVVGVAFVAKLIHELGQKPLLSLIYGLSAGCLLAIRVALPEPLAYAFVAAAVYSYFHKKYILGASLLGLAFFTKEVTIVFGAAFLLWLWLQRLWKESSVLLGMGFLPFGLWQLWLWQTFGVMGIASGGANATGFEWIPFMGLFRIASYSLVYFLAMLIVFAPLVVVPSLWGAWNSYREIREGSTDFITIALLLHALMMFFLPFSTYRETGGILRLSVGFVLAFLLYVVKENKSRAKRYLPFWLVYNVFLFR